MDGWAYVFSIHYILYCVGAIHFIRTFSTRWERPIKAALRLNSVIYILFNAIKMQRQSNELPLQRHGACKKPNSR